MENFNISLKNVDYMNFSRKFCCGNRWVITFESFDRRNDTSREYSVFIEFGKVVKVLMFVEDMHSNVREYSPRFDRLPKCVQARVFEVYNHNESPFFEEDEEDEEVEAEEVEESEESEEVESVGLSEACGVQFNTSYRYVFSQEGRGCRCKGGIRTHKGRVTIVRTNGSVLIRSNFVIQYDNDKLLSLLVCNPDALNFMHKDTGNVKAFIVNRFIGFMV